MIQIKWFKWNDSNEMIQIKWFDGGFQDVKILQYSQDFEVDFIRLFTFAIACESGLGLRLVTFAIACEFVALTMATTTDSSFLEASTYQTEFKAGSVSHFEGVYDGG